MDGGPGNDTLMLDNDDTLLDGEDGFDSLQISDANEEINVDGAFALAVNNIEVIDMEHTGFATNNTLGKSSDSAESISVQDVIDITDAGNTLVVIGEAGDTVNLTNGQWFAGATDQADTFGKPITSIDPNDPNTFDIYFFDSTMLFVDTDITTVNGTLLT